MSEERQSLLNRLKRIEGQVRGISKMISEEQDCAEILMQIAAVKAAVNKVGTLCFKPTFVTAWRQRCRKVKQIMLLMLWSCWINILVNCFAWQLLHK